MAGITFFSKDRTEKEIKFDRKFYTVWVSMFVIAVLLVVFDISILSNGWMRWVGAGFFLTGIVMNLVKGNIDWRKKKKREKENPSSAKTDMAKVQEMVDSTDLSAKKRERTNYAKSNEDAELDSFLALEHTPADEIAVYFAHYNEHLRAAEDEAEEKQSA